MRFTSVLDQLRKDGFRLTALRKLLIEFLVDSSKPLSVQELLRLLIIRKKLVNKTSIYREMEFLLKQGMIRELQLGDRKKHYEWNQNHHHHVICKGCDAIEDVDLKTLEDLLPKVERQLALQTQFANIQHSLEFFGFCKSCV